MERTCLQHRRGLHLSRQHIKKLACPWMRRKSLLMLRKARFGAARLTGSRASFARILHGFGRSSWSRSALWCWGSQQLGFWKVYWDRGSQSSCIVEGFFLWCLCRLRWCQLVCRKAMSLDCLTSFVMNWCRWSCVGLCRMWTSEHALQLLCVPLILLDGEPLPFTLKCLRPLLGKPFDIAFQNQHGHTCCLLWKLGWSSMVSLIPGVSCLMVKRIVLTRCGQFWHVGWRLLKVGVGLIPGRCTSTAPSLVPISVKKVD